MIATYNESYMELTGSYKVCMYKQMWKQQNPTYIILERIVSWRNHSTHAPQTRWRTCPIMKWHICPHLDASKCVSHHRSSGSTLEPPSNTSKESKIEASRTQRYQPYNWSKKRCVILQQQHHIMACPADREVCQSGVKLHWKLNIKIISLDTKQCNTHVWNIIEWFSLKQNAIMFHLSVT